MGNAFEIPQNCCQLKLAFRSFYRVYLNTNLYLWLPQNCCARIVFIQIVSQTIERVQLRAAPTLSLSLSLSLLLSWDCKFEMCFLICMQHKYAGTVWPDMGNGTEAQLACRQAECSFHDDTWPGTLTHTHTHTLENRLLTITMRNIYTNYICILYLTGGREAKESGVIWETYTNGRLHNAKVRFEGKHKQHEQQQKQQQLKSA